MCNPIVRESKGLGFSRFDDPWVFLSGRPSTARHDQGRWSEHRRRSQRKLPMMAPMIGMSSSGSPPGGRRSRHLGLRSKQGLRPAWWISAPVRRHLHRRLLSPIRAPGGATDSGSSLPNETRRKPLRKRAQSGAGHRALPACPPRAATGREIESFQAVRFRVANVFRRNENGL